jgi:hypothetical protein
VGKNKRKGIQKDETKNNIKGGKNEVFSQGKMN